jgi:hypothetical protein
MIKLLLRLNYYGETIVDKFKYFIKQIIMIKLLLTIVLS